jgi:cofilin
VSEFNDFKLRSKYRYMILGLTSDNKSITLLKAAEPSASYKDFLAELPADDCRYAVLKFDYDAGSDGTRSKIVFFMWYVLPTISTVWPC